MTTVIPAATACFTAGTIAVPSLACTMTTLYRLDVTASWSWLTWVGPSKLESRKVALALCELAYSWIPAQVAWANELALAKPKKPMDSFSLAEAAFVVPVAVVLGLLHAVRVRAVAAMATAISWSGRFTMAPRKVSRARRAGRQR